MKSNMMYTRDDVVNMFELFLDNYMNEDVSGQEESMASKYRENYTFVDDDGTKKSVRLYGKDKVETDAKFQALCCSVHPGQSKWNLDISFEEFVETQYKPSFMTEPFIAETTKGKYNYALKRYIYPEFGAKKIDSITVNDIQSFRKKLAEASEYGYKKNLTSKSIEDMTGLLNKIFKVAVAMNVIPDNPIKRPLLKSVGETPTHHKPMDPSILDYCKKHIPLIKDDRVRLYAAILFYNGGGMRPEEILGLRWENVYLDEGYVDILQAVTYALPKRNALVKTTKTPNSVRGVIFPKVLVELLRPFKKDSGFVIHGKDPNSPLPYSTWQRTYKKMQDELGIRGVYCNYDLRTTYATEMIEDGYSSTIVAKMMGHKDSRMVETVYAHTRRSGIEQMRSAIEEKNKAYGSLQVPKNFER